MVKNIVVKSNPNSVPIFIKDVAEVRFGHAVRYGALTYNGEVDAVGGVVMMLKGENSHEVVKRIKEKLPTIQKSLPEDVIIEPVRSILIPGFDAVKNNCKEAGALGGGISGSGPSIFMLSEHESTAKAVEVIMKNIYEKLK